MITLQTITGLLIAAVLNVQGTGQREVVQVENEPVVKEVSAQITDAKNETSKRLNLPWHFTGGLGDSPTEAENYQSGSASNCPSGSDTVCELTAPDDGNGQPDMDAEVEVAGVGTRTIAQRIADAIANNSPNETVTTLKSN
ncbi:hypothetical protein ACFOET_11465 [Parapedobacter deserti]|uniref:Uncharacterized protein n=1 Tax=Parapedobacter deserti TaxID=1912957 RepID=A0ABV7JJI9_9SPHI